MGQRWPGAGLGALSAAVTVQDLLKEVTIIFITSTIVWHQVKQQSGNTALPIDRKLDCRFTEHGPAHQNKTQSPPYPSQVSLSRQEASISLLFLSIGGQT